MKELSESLLLIISEMKKFDTKLLIEKLEYTESESTTTREYKLKVVTKRGKTN
jgi:hypothetical protein